MIETREFEQSLGRPIASIGRKPYSYRTSHRIDALDVALVDGTRLELLLKDLRRSELDPRARLAKPAFLHDPGREVEAYRVLANADLGTPRCYDAGEHWVLLEKVEGVELWQLGELEAWVAAARWLARFHSHFARRAPVSDRLIRYDAGYFTLWPDRAQRGHPVLARVVAAYERVVEILSALPTTFVHGEFYASNVLVADERIAAVDWEMAGVGPGILDLAALVTGWGEEERTAIIAGYGDVPSQALDAAQLHLALQWLGWSRDWSPPPEHARDWVADAMTAAERLGI
jgi:aminoglycoside phosphotransferase (APT) family kinase protein